MDELWCGLDLHQLHAADIAGLPPPAPVDDTFWPVLTDCAATFLAGDDTAACFGVAGIDDLAAGNNGDTAGKLQDDDGMDTSGFFAAAENDHHLMMQQYSSSSLSSKRSLSIDSGGSCSTLFSPLSSAATAAPGVFSPSRTAAPQAFARDHGGGDDEAAIMRAMMAVISSASPSSSESSSPALSQHNTATTTTTAVHQPRHRAPERTTTTEQQQHDDAKAAAGSNNNNSSSQVYHMMSERKRREKLNDSFHTLRSLLPPCSKKDKTTVLMSAANHLKALEAEVSDLELKNSKLERYVPGEGNGATNGTTHHHRRAKVHISRAAASSDEQQLQVVSLTVMVMVECDIVELVLHVLERLRWMAGVSVLSVDADTYSPQAVLKALANIKLHVVDGDCWDEALFRDAMTEAVHDATSSPSSSSSCAATAPLVAAA